jgi:hypothetical protein
MIFLNTSETLARIAGALPSGHRLLSLALELAAMTGRSDAAETAKKLFSPKSLALGWSGEIGVLGDPERSREGDAVEFLLWLGPELESAGSKTDGAMAVSPKPIQVFRQLVLNPPAGRYRMEYWDTRDCHLAGVEIGTSAPLVLGPPDCGAPLVILIISLL